MDELLKHLATTPPALRLGVFAGLAIITHLVVVVFRHFAALALASPHTRRYQKLRPVGTLATSVIVFLLCFLAIR